MWPVGPLWQCGTASPGGLGNHVPVTSRLALPPAKSRTASSLDAMTKIQLRVAANLSISRRRSSPTITAIKAYCTRSSPSLDLRTSLFPFFHPTFGAKPFVGTSSPTSGAGSRRLLHDSQIRMSSDADYAAFLDQANQDTGSTSAQTTKKVGTKSVNTTVPKALESIEEYYISDADEPFEPVALKFEGDQAPSAGKLVPRHFPGLGPG